MTIDPRSFGFFSARTLFFAAFTRAERHGGGILVWPKTYAFGAQAVFRQGFKKVQIQGVEFAQMGQGGILGRYPVHFHLARRVPKDTYVIDSAINESMTRWIVIHSTLGVTLARNVGWKSIGHGYFLEDATEVDNKLYANIGIFARAAIAGDANPRQIPGLLAAPNAPMTLPLKYHSDTHYPSVFWLTNGWNTVAGNMAAGAGTCGACYWYVAAGNHDMMDVQPDGQMGKNPKAMTWAGYALIQQRTLNNQGLVSRDGAGQSPVKLFYKNYCSSAMHSLTTSDESPCVQTETGMVTTLNNPTAPPAPGDEQSESAASKM